MAKCSTVKQLITRGRKKHFCSFQDSILDFGSPQSFWCRKDLHQVIGGTKGDFLKAVAGGEEATSGWGVKGKFCLTTPISVTTLTKQMLYKSAIMIM